MGLLHAYTDKATTRNMYNYYTWYLVLRYFVPGTLVVYTFWKQSRPTRVCTPRVSAIRPGERVGFFEEPPPMLAMRFYYFAAFSYPTSHI